MASRGMRTTVTMSTAETANAAPDTNTTGSMPNRPNSKPPSTGPTRPESALIWLTMAVARTMPSRGAMNGTAACTVGWYTLCAAYRTMSSQKDIERRHDAPLVHAVGRNPSDGRQHDVGDPRASRHRAHERRRARLVQHVQRQGEAQHGIAEQRSNLREDHRNERAVEKSVHVVSFHLHTFGWYVYWTKKEGCQATRVR